MTGDGNWTWLLPGAVPTLIDAGTGRPEHLEALETALAGASLSQVIVTHGHVDHASGATAIKARFPDARFLKAPWPDRDVRYPVGWERLQDGDLIRAGDTALLAVATPGHAPDHLCLWDEGSRTVFCGDLAVKGTTVFIPSGPDGDLAAYLSSLQRVRDLEPQRMLPAHGAVIEAPGALIDTYVRHRLEREEQVLAGLRSGDSSPDALVERIYRGVKPALLPVARETVLAHLIKLERERRVRRHAEAWHIIEP